MKCKSTGRLIIAELAGELNRRQAAKLKKHLDSCPECRREFEQFAKLWKLTGKTLGADEFGTELSPDRRDKIFADVQRQYHPFRKYVVSLAELLAVPVICVILAGMLLPSLHAPRQKARSIAAKTRLKLAQMEAAEKELETKKLRKPSPLVVTEENFKLDEAEEQTAERRSKDQYSSDKGQASRVPATQAAKSLSATGMVSKSERPPVNGPMQSADSKSPGAPGESRLFSPGKVVHRREKRRSVLPAKTFSVNLKLWNMTTPGELREYLRQNNCPADFPLQVNPRNNTITVNAPDAVIEKLQELFDKLRGEEKKLRDLSGGLPFVKTSMRPVSTFSIDTDTASYIQARKCIRKGECPNPLKIRPEDFINYFDYHYRSPRQTAFAVYLEAAPSPFRQQNTLFRIGIQGKRLGPGAFSRSHYVILLDVSGSMAVNHRMELAKKAIAMLLENLRPSDYISLLVCGSRTRLLSGSGNLKNSRRRQLLAALAATSPQGTADLAQGISTAYEFAEKHFLPGGSNRVIIISDGIFELNAEGRRNIDRHIAAARKRGISNIVIGLGGDGDDEMLEKVAAQGDGSYVFLDNEREIQELFTASFEARFREIAHDVKIQVDFNPEAVASYRLIGYQNRRLSSADFRNDAVDAGEVGSGQAVTALYELKLKPGLPRETATAAVRIRYKNVSDLSVEEKTFCLYSNDIKSHFSESGAAFKLAAYIAEFAESLRYPETLNVASPRAIGDELRKLWIKEYRNDVKVTELLELIGKSK
ncbi:MAG: von Willebrand factor type A domain-containing protein [Victivallales bacterium]|nr:von Willebrand factor type A domain-containing protein [Victivallales bacterium]